MAHYIAKYIHKTLNIADFQCTHKGKYTLNVNIHVSSCEFYIQCTICLDRITNNFSRIFLLKS